tara:strand:- start:806 stop:1060 length:255 start_codon:yes stop_codon:yes gene_type:complete
MSADTTDELPEIFWEVEKWAGSEIGWELVGRFDNEEEAQAAFDAIKTTTLKNIMRWRRTTYAAGPSADLLNLIDKQDKEAMNHG